MSPDSRAPDEAAAKKVLADVRKAAGLSQRAAAEAFGKHHNLLWQWESSGDHGTGVDQVRYLLMLGMMSEAARFVLLRNMGLGHGELGEAEEPDMRDRMDRLREIREAAKNDPSVRFALNGIDMMIEKAAEEAAKG